MFPTVGQQLRETRRILTDVVAPEVSGDYAATALDDVLATLSVLETAWDQILPFLQWDNGQLAVLLGHSSVDADLAERIAVARATDPPDPLDFLAVHECNLE